MAQEAQGRVTHNFSCDAIESKGLAWLASRKYADANGKLRRGAISWTLVDLFVERLQSELGDDWANCVAPDDGEAA
jgi:hypothetical protein